MSWTLFFQICLLTFMAFCLLSILLSIHNDGKFVTEFISRNYRWPLKHEKDPK